MYRSSRIVPCLLGAALALAGVGSGRAATLAEGGRFALAQGFPGDGDGAPPVPGGPFGSGRPLGFPPPPFARPPFLMPAAAVPRCPLIIRVGRGLARPARTRVISGRPACT